MDDFFWGGGCLYMQEEQGEEMLFFLTSASFLISFKDIKIGTSLGEKESLLSKGSSLKWCHDRKIEFK